MREAVLVFIVWCASGLMVISYTTPDSKIRSGKPFTLDYTQYKCEKFNELEETK